MRSGNRRASGFAGGRVSPSLRDDRVLSWMRRQARAGVRIGAAGLGSFILARAGLLDGYRCTVHWKLLPKFRDEFPHLNVTDEIYEIDRNRHTSSGGTGTLDVMLALIAGDHGETLASHVAEEFLHERICPSSHSQRMPLRFRLNITNRKVLNAVRLIEESIENPLSCASIAGFAGCFRAATRKVVSRSPRHDAKGVSAADTAQVRPPFAHANNAFSVGGWFGSGLFLPVELFEGIPCRIWRAASARPRQRQPTLSLESPQAGAREFRPASDQPTCQP